MARTSRTGGKWSAAKTRKASLVEGRKPTKTKRRISTTASRNKSSTVSDLAKELKESREQQAATAEILKVIASSPDDEQPVLKAVAERTNHLVGGFTTVVWRILDDVAHLAAFTHAHPAVDAALKTAAFRIPLSSWQVGETIRRGEVFSVADTEVDARSLRDLARLRGFRSVLYVPMLRNREPIGIIGVTRAKPGKFADHHVRLLRTFADQAVIAIENARLFNDVQAKTRDLEDSLRQQTATADVLKTISSSLGDLEPVFKAILENATNICEAKFGHLFLRDGGDFLVAALRSKDAAYPEWLKLGTRLAVLDNPRGPLAQIVRTEGIVHIADLSAERAYAEGNTRMVALVESSGARTFLGVPMFKDDVLIGVIAIYRQEVRSFTEKQIALLCNFAAQAVIAIENARLLNELRMRTNELSQSLDDLRAAQDRLVQTQKLASLGQLTAGIAHEIKNPLNFVNNFSGLSTELVGELQGILSGISIDPETHADIKELTKMLRANLEKIAQHGKRADAIVKSMLLHSGQSSGEHRFTDINALVEESLNRAYYGERAETRGFTVKLERLFDPTAGEVDLFPREIARALLNLISNGFYAATKRKEETKDSDYEPTLAAATKNLGDRVEIRIRDNGIGIPAEVKEKMFDPFFTTKPPGEGTGLGLSISHDIIVKQHGGSIEVDTEPGEFAEICVILPRAAASVPEGS